MYDLLKKYVKETEITVSGDEILLTVIVDLPETDKGWYTARKIFGGIRDNCDRVDLDKTYYMDFIDNAYHLFFELV